MKVIRLRFVDGNEITTSGSDRRVHRVRPSHDIHAGELCRYLTDGVMVVAQIIEVDDIDPDTDNSPSNSVVPKNADELAKLREDIKNDVLNEILKLAPWAQDSPVASEDRSKGIEIKNEPEQPVEQSSMSLELLNLIPESGTSAPPPEKRRRVSPKKSSPPASHDDEFSADKQQSGCSDIGSWLKDGRVTSVFPTDAQMLVKTPYGSYAPVRTMSYDVLVKAFEAKWKTVKLPPIAEKLDIPLAVEHLTEPCLKAFIKTNARSFMYLISSWIFEEDVLHAAFIPGKTSAFCARNRNPRYNWKRTLNAEAQEAFNFLVDYFSTILVDPSDAEYVLWHEVIRNIFNHRVGEVLKRDRNGGFLAFSPDKFVVLQTHVPYYTSDNAY